VTELLDHRGNPVANGVRTIDPVQLLTDYEVLSVDQSSGTIVLADRSIEETEPPEPIDKELAKQDNSQYAQNRLQDYNPDLRGQRALERYREMRNDAQVRSSLRVMKTPVLAARWFMEAASKDQQDRDIAQFVWDCLHDYMSMSWHKFLEECLLILDYGTYSFEKVYDRRIIDGEERIVWKKLAPRSPLLTHEYLYSKENGSPLGITYGAHSTFIPMEKLLIFSFENEAGLVEGRSVLRSAYRHWYYKENLYKIDAIQKERHGVGVPIIKLPSGFKLKDKQLAHEIGRNLRANEKAHVVIPPGWEIEFAKLEGQQVDALMSAEHHGQQIYENTLAGFMAQQSRGATSSDLVERQEQMFMRATRYVADGIRDVINKYAIPQLVRWNFGVTHYPQLRVRRLGDTTDWRTISFAMRNFSGMGALRPDEPLEDWVREEMDLPERDEETMRIVETPQNAPVGQPNQSTAPAQGTGEGPEGADASGVT